VSRQRSSLTPLTDTYSIEFLDLPNRFSEIATEEDKKFTGVRFYKHFLAEFEPERLIYLKDLPRLENTTGEWVKA
jgi:hypothetical protein